VRPHGFIRIKETLHLQNAQKTQVKQQSSLSNMAKADGHDMLDHPVLVIPLSRGGFISRICRSSIFN